METTLFVTKEYLEKQFKSFNNTLVKPNDKKIKEWLTTLNGDVDVEGSIANTIAKKVAEVISGAPEDYDTLKEIADWISNHASNAEEMLAKIEANKEGILSENEKIELVEGIINTLNGSIDEEGSIAKMLKDAINTSVDNIIICESEDEDIDFNSASWLKGEVEPLVFTASDIVGDKSTLTSYVIPEGYTDIDDNAFQNLANLDSITLPSTLKTIGLNAFNYCPKLTSVTIPKGVTEIGDGAFKSCSNLKEVNIPKGVTKIGSNAFQGCRNLDPIVIPASVTEISSDSFEDWSKVTFASGSQFKIKNGFIVDTKTGNLIACVDKSIEVATIPNGITSIDKAAFNSCSNLKEINIPASVTEIGDKAFAGCSNLEHVLVPTTVTSIESGSFDDWSIVDFAEGSPYDNPYWNEYGMIVDVESGVLVTYRDKTIESLVIPEGVTEIKDKAFCNFKNLKSVELPSTLNKIGTCAFMQTGLTSLTIPGNVTEIPEGMCVNCQKLKNVDIHEGVTEIGDNAFDLCLHLDSVTLPSTMTSIGNAAFNGTNLGTTPASITEIPASVTDIGYLAFNRLDKVFFEEGSPYRKENGIIYNAETGTLIGVYEDKESNVTNSFVFIPTTITKIEPYAFDGCKSLERIVYTGSEEQWNAITKEQHWDSSLSNVTVEFDHTTFMRDDVEHDITSLRSINIPEGITEIGSYTFQGCTNLESVTLPSTLKKIGYQEFAGCTSLTSIEIPEGVTEINEYAFAGCPLTSINIPEGVTEIRQGVFASCSKLTSVTLPSTLTKIGSAFQGCDSLTSIEIPESVTAIGEYAFYGCDVSVVIPASVTEISLNSFSNWDKVTFAEGSPFKKENDIIWNTKTGALLGCYDKNITSIVIPEGVTEIAGKVSQGAFQQCNNLASVTLPSTLKKIESYAFQGCSSLTSIVIPEGVTEIGNIAFQQCNNLASVTLPSTLTKIGYQAFYKCSSLTSINIPASVTEIGHHVFDDLSKVTFAEGSPFKKENGIVYNAETGVLVGCYDKTITSIVIPEGVTEIGDTAFSECSKLTSVTLLSTLTKIGSSAFQGCKSLTSINYTGTEEQWNAITKNANWKVNMPSTVKIVYNYSA